MSPFVGVGELKFTNFEEILCIRNSQENLWRLNAPRKLITSLISFVLSHRNLKDRWRVQRTFIPSRSTMHVQSPWKVHSDKRTEGRQISVFNIIDYQLDFTTKDDENSRVCFEKKQNKTKNKQNEINWWIFICFVSKNIRCVDIKQKIWVYIISVYFLFPIEFCFSQKRDFLLLKEIK